MNSIVNKFKEKEFWFFKILLSVLLGKFIGCYYTYELQ